MVSRAGEYEEGTYLSECTEAVLAPGRPAGSEVAATAVTGGSFGCLAIIVGVVGLLCCLAAFPFGLVIGIPLIALAIYLAGGTGAGLLTAAGDMRPMFLRGECPYCGHVREAKRVAGDRLACARCLNIFVIRGNQFHIPEDRLKRFRKKIPH